MLTSLAQLQIEWGEAIAPWSPLWIHETLGSMLVGMACGVLGCFVVLRRMALIGDALSHAILPGVVVALILFGAAGAAERFMPVWLLVGALVAGLLTAVLINFLTRASRSKEDASIGIVFTAMFAVGLILISSLPRGTHFDLKCFVYGDPLAIGTQDLWLMAIVCPLVVVVVALMYHRLKLISFDPTVAAAMGVPVTLTHYLLMGLLAATIVSGIKSTGVILVVAMVITPASAAYQLTNRFGPMLVMGGVFGAASAALGMSVAFVFNTPSGPAMVLVASVIFVLAVLLSPSHGFVIDQIRRRKLARHVAAEDVLKALYRLGGVSVANATGALREHVELAPSRIERTLGRLRGEGLVGVSADSFDLTDAGRDHAERLVRAHRLWETYLADRAGVTGEQLHREAERLEHAHDLAEQLDESLGRPAVDPHGSTIPRQS